jgi:hypothetical protein
MEIEMNLNNRFLAGAAQQAVEYPYRAREEAVVRKSGSSEFPGIAGWHSKLLFQRMIGT